MTDFRFDGRTAVVTGAGGKPGLGRAHALLLASRGARVVVNDIGNDPESQGYSDRASAAAVAAEINALGGAAIADTHSVASSDGAAALIGAALEAFGSIDILVNNAGVVAIAPFDEMTVRDYERHMQINLLGAIWTSRAAWPHMRRQSYGRIINIGSGAFSGIAMHAAYGVTKGGLFSLTRALAAEGAPHGIQANTVNPFAFTRMMQATQEESSPLLQMSRAALPAEMVSPVVAYLAHETCAVTGECFSAAGGSVKRVFLSETQGLSDPNLTVERLAEAWDKVMDETGARLMRAGDAQSKTEDVKPYRPQAR